METFAQFNEVAVVILDKNQPQVQIRSPRRLGHHRTQVVDQEGNVFDVLHQQLGGVRFATG